MLSTSAFSARILKLLRALAVVGIATSVMACASGGIGPAVGDINLLAASESELSPAEAAQLNRLQDISETRVEKRATQVAVAAVLTALSFANDRPAVLPLLALLSADPDFFEADGLIAHKLAGLKESDEVTDISVDRTIRIALKEHEESALAFNDIVSAEEERLAEPKQDFLAGRLLPSDFNQQLKKTRAIAEMVRGNIDIIEADQAALKVDVKDPRADPRLFRYGRRLERSGEDFAALEGRLDTLLADTPQIDAEEVGG